ncbi:diacylglycerol kinase family protein, partial [Escherichia coli]|uniref:diacylglycerol kinase family protein n=1 Tax=Escherichia coli TaxID=562 RepID=UPI003EE3E1F8
IPALGILPLGTANDFATSVGIPEALDKALKLAIAEDTGKINYGVVLFCMPDKVFTPYPALRILSGS